MKFGVPISFAIHALFLGGGIFLFKNPPPLETERLIVPVDIISIAEKTNIRATIKRPVTQPELQPEIPTSETPLENAPEIDPVETPENIAKAIETPTETPVEPRVDEVQAPEDIEDISDTENEDTNSPKDEETVFNLDNLSALVDRSRDTQPEANQQRVLQSEETLYAFADVTRRGAGEADGLSLSEIDALRAAMYRCWRIPAEARDPESLIIPVEVKLHRDGHVASVTLKNAARINGSSNPYMKIAADNALRAVSKCGPYDFLPEDRYEDWRQMDLTFRPVLSQ